MRRDMTIKKKKNTGSDTWTLMLRALVKFKNENGHCDVPLEDGKGSKLARWVRSIREQKDACRLSEARVRKLNQLGFNWSARPAHDQAHGVEQERKEFREIDPGERLYFVSYGEYVQYGGKGKMPKALSDYLARNRGQYPPFIPLPRGPVEFVLSTSVKPIRWNGKDGLPEQVLEHVREHGSLPRNSTDSLEKKPGQDE